MKNKILPIITAAVVVIAICVIIFIPKNKASEEVTATVKNDVITTAKTNSDDKSTELNESNAGDNDVLEIKADDLNSDEADFINYETANGYTVELIAVKDSDNNINVAFNTCQVCNGSPKAYFIQTNGTLVCQNCGNVFSLNSVGQYASGCNPIALNKNHIVQTETGITIRKDFLTQNEGLFANVESH